MPRYRNESEGDCLRLDGRDEDLVVDDRLAGVFSGFGYLRGVGNDRRISILPQLLGELVPVIDMFERKLMLAENVAQLGGYFLVCNINENWRTFPNAFRHVNHVMLTYSLLASQREPVLSALPVAEAA